MAIIRVRSTDGNDADNGSTWALAKATIAGGLNAASAGDSIWVSHQHAESIASTQALTSAGTAALPVYILCVNDGSDPATALATTATMTTTGNTQIQFHGFAFCYGVSFFAGSGGAGSATQINLASVAPFWWRFHSCHLSVGTTSATARMAIGSAASSPDDFLVEFVNTTVNFNHASQGMVIQRWFRWFNTPTALTGATLPTTLVQPGTVGGSPDVLFEGVDLSALGSGNSIFTMSGPTPGRYVARNCKLGASVGLTTGAHPGPGGTSAEFINCDSGDTTYRYFWQDFPGTIESETTIVRTGGATNGTTPISREMVTNASVNKSYPLFMRDLVFFNTTVGSTVTLTVHTVTDNVTLTDQDCWLEVEYLGTSGFPLSLLAEDADSISDRFLGGSASNQTTSTETWTTTGLTTPVKQQLEVTVTPQEIGPIRCRVMLARPSTTVYVCPKVMGGPTSTRQFQAADSVFIIEESAGGGGGGGPLIGGRLVR